MNFDRLKDYLDSMITKYNAPGVDCIVYKDHKKLFRYYTGMSDIENKKEMTGNEMYLIFSMTKMLTCTSALQLMERGKFHLDDPVSMYLPSFDNMKLRKEDGSLCYAENPITIRHLFTMSAGLSYDIEAESIRKAISEGKTSTLDIVNAIGDMELLFEPGTRFKYSLCHDVLGGLVEVWSGKKLGEYMKENIFDPLGMKETFFGLTKDEKQLSRMAAKYIYNDDRTVSRTPLECRYQLTKDYESGGAGLTSVPEDYALFLDALASGGVGKTGERILSHMTIDLMSTNHLNETQLKDFYEMRNGYGYGLGVRTHYDKAVTGCVSPLKEFGWDGAAGGFSMVDCKNKLSLTLFQHVHKWDHKIHTELRNVLYACMEDEVKID